MKIYDATGNDFYPYAVIPPSHDKNGGIFIGKGGGAGRTSLKVEDAMKVNPPALINGLVENLKPAFYDWCDAQQRENKPGRFLIEEFRLTENDLLPIDADVHGNMTYLNCIAFAEDTRTMDDYADIYPINDPHVDLFCITPKTNTDKPRVIKKCRRKKQPLKD